MLIERQKEAVTNLKATNMKKNSIVITERRARLMRGWKRLIN